MNLSRSILTVALLAAVAIPEAHAEIAIDVIGGSEVSFEGLVQTDGYWYDSDVFDLNADPNDGSDADYGLRRAELVLKGKGPGNFDWVLGYDAVGDKFLDVNVKYKIGGSKQDYLLVGQFKQPNSLEELSSTKNNDFITKAYITNTYAVGRRLGVGYNYGGDNWQVTASYFGRELTRNLGAGSGYGVRGGWAPLNESGKIFYIGASYINRDVDDDTIRIRTRPAADFSQRLIDTNIRNADRLWTTGLESFFVTGPFKLQAEYMTTTVDRYDTGFASQPGDNYTTDGYYVSGLWNITGETWSNKSGVPGTASPENPGSGMWQLGLRYEAIDLNDGIVQPGKLNSTTVGVNYYWRSNFKLALDYSMVKGRRNGVDDDPSVIGARAQFYW